MITIDGIEGWFDVTGTSSISDSVDWAIAERHQSGFSSPSTLILRTSWAISQS